MNTPFSQTVKAPLPFMKQPTQAPAAPVQTTAGKIGSNLGTKNRYADVISKGLRLKQPRLDEATQSR